MRGYRGEPAATAQAFDAEGWLHTGDLGHVDATGVVTVADRLKDLIKVDGYQVSPAEVEAVLRAHPESGDVVVVGESDPRHGEVPVAYLTGTASEQALDLWARERLTRYKRPSAYRRVDAVPRTPSGKVLRRLLAGGVRVDQNA
jgi:acyl-CoA synthetase (AMP-forming)/AMP-acid ligase II